MMFQIKRVNQDKEFLLLFAGVIVAIGFVLAITTFAPQAAHNYFFLVITPPALVVFGFMYLTDKIVGEPTNVTINSDGILVVNQKTGKQQSLLFSELIKYRVVNSFRGRASLRLISENGSQLALRGLASTQFTALIKEFDAACQRYERRSGRTLTRIDMA